MPESIECLDASELGNLGKDLSRIMLSNNVVKIIGDIFVQKARAKSVCTLQIHSISNYREQGNIPNLLETSSRNSYF